MDRVEQRRDEHEAELDRLGHSGQEAGESQAEQHAADRLAPLGPRFVIHGEAGGGQAEHHDREKPAHEGRSEEHTSELQSLMRISYAVFCLKKKNKNNNK